MNKLGFNSISPPGGSQQTHQQVSLRLTNESRSNFSIQRDSMCVCVFVCGVSCREIRFRKRAQSADDESNMELAESLQHLTLSEFLKEYVRASTSVRQLWFP